MTEFDQDERMRITGRKIKIRLSGKYGGVFTGNFRGVNLTYPVLVCDAYPINFGEYSWDSAKRISEKGYHSIAPF